MKSIIMTLIIAATVFGFENAQASDLRIGLIGLDTSHAPAFARMLNDSTDSQHLSGARIVCAFAGGSPDVESSASRVEKFTQRVASYDVEIVADIATLIPKVDAVILTSVDGRVHLEQARPVIAAKLPLFIDKPMAASVADVKEIFRLTDEAGVPCFSASSLRYFPELQNALHDESLGDITGCDAYSPAKLEPHHPDLMWYGVHGVEILFAALGPDCRRVRRISTDGTDIVVGEWADGRLGTFRGIREGKARYGAMLFGEKDARPVAPDTRMLYFHLMKEILAFFRSGEAPIPAHETIAMFEFMEAADASKDEGGAWVELH